MTCQVESGGVQLRASQVLPPGVGACTEHTCIFLHQWNAATWCIDTAHRSLLETQNPGFFIVGWWWRHSACMTSHDYRNSRLLEGKQVFIINHAVCTKSLHKLVQQDLVPQADKTALSVRSIGITPKASSQMAGKGHRCEQAFRKSNDSPAARVQSNLWIVFYWVLVFFFFELLGFYTYSRPKSFIRYPFCRCVLQLVSRFLSGAPWKAFGQICTHTKLLWLLCGGWIAGTRSSWGGHYSGPGRRRWWPGLGGDRRKGEKRLHTRDVQKVRPTRHASTHGFPTEER